MITIVVKDNCWMIRDCYTVYGSFSVWGTPRITHWSNILWLGMNWGFTNDWLAIWYLRNQPWSSIWSLVSRNVVDNWLTPGQRLVDDGYHDRVAKGDVVPGRTWRPPKRRTNGERSTRGGLSAGGARKRRAAVLWQLWGLIVMNMAAVNDDGSPWWMIMIDFSLPKHQVELNWSWSWSEAIGSSGVQHKAAGSREWFSSNVFNTKTIT